MKKTALSLLSCLAALPAFGAYSLNLVNQVNVGSGGAEILSYQKNTGTIASTASGGIQLYSFSGGAVSTGAFADFSSSFGTTSGLDNISSTALDPLNRGFGLAALIPNSNGGELGQLGFYDYSTGAVLGSVNVGYHPDSVIFSGDGRYAFVANEGENGADGGEVPGSVSVIDLLNVSSTADIGNAVVNTYDFQGQDLSGLRDYASPNAPTYMNIEPEYLSYSNGKLYVSLQENNGIAEFDTATSSWSNIWSLGTRDLVVDASDLDGVNVDDAVKGLPMPDTIASFEKDGTTYIVTANEGDAASDDEERVKDLGTDGLPAVDPATIAALNLIYGDFTDNEALGRLQVSIMDGDTDGDGDIDELTMFGTRGFSILDDEGNLVVDSGSLENLLLAMEPDVNYHNAEGEGGIPDSFDGRSDNKGPEPEGLDVIQLEDGTVLLALGMERQNGILLFDITDPSNPLALDYINSYEDGMIAPESLKFIEDDEGRLFLLTGYEVSGNYGIYSLDLTAVPEPAAYAAFAGVLGLGLVLWRRRRTA
ncbi:MAG: Uncharacterized protein E1N59_3165 [Puniceicoccaceae bacterium 5H]|nr:MAG: Uncharacterized protein E1N59_3165 [Puniceicoccaceae bacterium 5H]